MKRIAILPQVGEVDGYQRFGGEPLIIHSGRYRRPFR